MGFFLGTGGKDGHLFLLLVEHQLLELYKNDCKEGYNMKTDYKKLVGANC
jgi:hypothetical protein